MPDAYNNIGSDTFKIPELVNLITALNLIVLFIVLYFHRQNT